MAKILWLDDLRDPKDYGYEDAIWLKSFEDWLSFVSDEDNFNNISEIHFDNDLGEDHEGYHAFLDVECMLYAGEWDALKTIYVHTSNPSAAGKYMLAKENFISSYGVEIKRVNY